MPLLPRAFNPFSSRSTFDRWLRRRAEPARRPSPPPGFRYPVQPAESWLLHTGWTQLSSALYLDAIPGRPRRVTLNSRP